MEHLNIPPENHVKVLGGQGWVGLIDHLGTEATLVNAARVSFGKLKSTMDMMTGTSAIFAPLILGMSIVMLGPITEITGQVFFDNIGLTLAIYLVELAALISLMSSNLMCKGKTVDVMARFALMMPISLIVFMICSSFSL